MSQGALLNTDVDDGLARQRRTRTRLRRLDRILGQWDEQEIAGMGGTEPLGFALLKIMRQSLVEQLDAEPERTMR